MNIININDEYNSKIEKNNEDINSNNLEIDLLETINKKDLFKNIENYEHIKKNFMNKKNILMNQNQYITDNYQINNDEIVDENSDIIQNNDDLNDNKNNFNTEKEEKINYNENYVDFNSFISKNKEKINKIKTFSKSLKNEKIIKNKTLTPNRKNIKNMKNENNKTNDIQKEPKKKLTKERIEINKKRINNLYNDYQKILNMRRKKKEELSKEEIKDCSFSPEIDKNSKKITKNNSKFSKPIFLRYNNNKERKNILLKKYSPNFTHIPKINKKYKINSYYNDINKTKEKSKIIVIKNKNINEQIKNANILKRQILLDDYMNQQRIINFNNKINLSKMQNTFTYSKSQFSNKMKIDNNLNKSQIYPTIKKMKIKNNMNVNINKFNNSYSNKKIQKSKSFYLDCVQDINRKNKKDIIHKQKFIPIISIDKIDKYYNYYKNRNHIVSNINEKENVIQNYINKINDNIHNRKTSKGICYNITEQCINIKKIIFKNKKKFRIYK